jgi:hypothetical protein
MAQGSRFNICVGVTAKKVSIERYSRLCILEENYEMLPMAKGVGLQHGNLKLYFFLLRNKNINITCTTELQSPPRSFNMNSSKRQSC